MLCNKCRCSKVQKKSEPIEVETQTNANEPHIGQYKPENMSNIPPFLLNAVIDDEAGEVNIMALVHGIEVLEKQVNATTCPKVMRGTRKNGYKVPLRSANTTEKLDTRCPHRYARHT